MEADHSISTGDPEAPVVTVVVPVRNSPGSLQRCLEGLFSQSYPSSDYEVIVVDNGSEDETPDVARTFPARVVRADDVVSPYAARNAGMASARGAIVAFIDASCVPAPDWLERGVSALARSGADLAGGRVLFTFSDDPSIGELADGLMNVDVEASIVNHAACMTGNLFVRRRVMDAIGPFESHLRSGGDMRWTRRATDAGFRLVFVEDAPVRYPARPLAALLRKQYRVGRGVPGVWRAFGLGRSAMVLSSLRGLLPPPPDRFVSLAERRLEREIRDLSPPRWVALWSAVWLAKLTRAAGSLAGLFGTYGIEPERAFQPSSGDRTFQGGDRAR